MTKSGKSTYKNHQKPWPLTWIPEDKLLEICKNTIKAGAPETEEVSYKNMVDPFSALFDMAINNMTYDDWKGAEIRRQHQKRLQNAIGKFHQDVLGAIDGWENLNVGEGIDIQNKGRKIFAEIKNKHNTVKGSDLPRVYDELKTFLKPGYTGYYVQILAKSKFNRPFVPSDNLKTEKAESNERIREIDGRSFYALATGSKTAFDDLYEVLPCLLQEITRGEFDAEIARNHSMYRDLIERTKPKLPTK